MSEKKHQLGNLFELSLSQKNIWNLEQRCKETSINNIGATIRFKGHFNVALVQKSINLVLEADLSLRTRIKLVNGEPWQYHVDYEPEQIPVFDFSQSGEGGVASWEATLTYEKMQLFECPLYYFAVFKTGEESGGVLIKTHHILSDGWSQVQIGNRISQTYLELLSEKEVTLEALPDYERHVLREKKYLSSPAHERDRAYWNNLVADFAEPRGIKECKGALVSMVGRRRTYPLSELINHSLQVFCAKNRVAPFAVFYMALAIYLRRISGANRLSIGVPIHNRSDFIEKQTTGMFISTLPFLSEMDENWSFEEFNQHMMEDWYGLLRHQRFPFSEIVAAAKASSPDITSLFKIVLSYQCSRMTQGKDTTIVFSGRWHYSGYQAEELIIHLSNLEKEGSFSVDYDYLVQVFSEHDIDRLHKYLCKILEQALAEPQRPIWQLPILQSDEKEKVVFAFNQTLLPIYEESVYHVFARVAAENPKRVALICDGKRMYYNDLAERAGQYAGAIEERAPGGGQIVAISMKRSAELIAAMLGILRVGNAWVILPPALPPERFYEMLKDSSAALLIVDQAQRPEKAEVPVLLAEEVLPQTAAVLPVREAAPHDLAYIVYTSGSTGKPKGVEIEQISLINFAKGMSPLYGYGGVLSLCNIGFDAFILESIVSLLNARTLVLANEWEQENPVQLAALIRNFAVGFLAMTPSRLQAAMKYPEFVRALRRVESIVCGGEALSSELVQELKMCTNARVYNQYGPSETTIGVSYKCVNNSHAITIGKPMQNCRLYVLDEHKQPLPIGVYGDLYVGGLCVGRGYHNAPQATAESFFESPFEQRERIYKTGDIACWDGNGELCLGGRKDNQVKIRGVRIEPEEIAARLTSFPGIDQAAVKVVRQQGATFLAAYYIADSEIPEAELFAFTATYLPSYMIPAYLKRIDVMPLTPNGKIHYARLPDPEIRTEGKLPVNAEEKKLLSLFRSVLNRSDMDVESDYFLFGGDSLNATELICEIEQAFGVSLKIADIYAFRTVRALERRLGLHHMPRQQEGQEEKELSIAKAPVQDAYPLTPSQQSLYFQTQMDPAGLAYNMPGAFRLAQPVDHARLEDAFAALIRSEEVLRTGFVFGEKGLVQKIREQVPFALSVLSAASLSDAAQLFVKPFDLAAPPLLRAALWEDAQGQWYLFVDMHHIISDGISSPMLLHRLAQLYSGESVKLPRIGYKDYAYWLKEQPEEKKAGQRLFWQEKMKGIAEPLDLPTDFPRMKTFDYRGDSCQISFGAELSLACEEYCREKELSPYMLFVGVLGILLSKISGSEDIVIGTPVSGRRNKELWQVVGAFLNMLPLRLQPRGSVADYLQQVRQEVLALIDNQDVSLEEIIAMTQISRSLGQNSLYNILFSLRPASDTAFTLGGGKMELFPLQTGTAKMDLNIEIYQEKEGFVLAVEYATSLFCRETIELYLRSFKRILEQVLRAEQPPVAEISAVARTDAIVLWEKPNRVRLPFVNLCIDQMIDQYAEMNPDLPAVYFHGHFVSYGELKARADALAGQLVEAGVRRGNYVALACSRTVDMIAGVLAILKVGAAYVPVLPVFPEARLRSILETAKIKFIFCDENANQTLPKLDGYQRIQMRAEQTEFVPVKGRSPEDAVYVLFTSGSTGQPKGVVIAHRSVANLCAYQEQLTAGIQGSMLCISGVVFDTFVMETLLPLAVGTCVALADEEEMMLPWKVAALIREAKVEIVQSTPSRLQLFLGNEAFFEALSAVQLIISGGESASRAYLSRLISTGAKRVCNLYGPTEATVYVTAADMTNREQVVIGKAVANCRLYVLDENQNPVMPTARGELYIAGECLAKGYVNRPDLTEQAFVPDPFYPGERMYRSGDIVRLTADGNIAYLGRRDEQVKLNGQRIELEEITGQLIETGLVLDAATITVQKRDGSMDLRAFAVPKPGEIVAEKQIRVKMQDFLPAYMVPSAITFVDCIPRTATGKTDKKRLAEYERLAQEAPKQESPQEVSPAKVITQIWQTALERKEIDPAVSFFDQGGTSLGALHVLVQYFNRKWTMTLAQFYENPTVQAQAELVQKQMGIQPGTSPVREVVSFAAPEKKDPQAPQGKAACGIAPAPEDPVGQPRSKAVCGNGPAPETRGTQAAVTRCEGAVPAGKSGERPPQETLKNTVLVTGATGFLGAHLVKALLAEGTPRVACLVRGDSARLRETLSFYFGEGWFRANRHAMQAVVGNVAEYALGMEPDRYEALQKTVHTVIHAAADTRHYAAESEAMRMNRDGTRNVIAFSRTAQACLLHISTMSVGGEYLPATPEKEVSFSETDRDIGQNWQENIYVKTKFMAEEQVFAAIASGLNAKVYRIGRLVGRSEDGVFQRNPQNNTFYQMIRGFSVLDCLPSRFADYPVELTGIDLCAQAILRLRTDHETVFHVMNPHSIALRKLCQTLRLPTREVSDAEFEQHLMEKAVKGGNSAQLAQLIDMWNHFKLTPQKIQYRADRTTKALAEKQFFWREPEVKILLASFLE